MTRPPNDERLELLLQQAQRAGIWRRQAHTAGHVFTAEAAELAGGLWARAFPTLKALLKSNKIAPQMRKLGICVPQLTDDHRDAITGREENRDELAAEMILARIEPFLEQTVVDRAWDRSQSALTTHFINGCLLSYPSVYRRWAKQRKDITGELDLNTITEVRRDISLDLADREAVRELVEQAPPPVRPILGLLWLGYTQREVAEQLGISPNAVANRLYHFRRRKVIPKVVRRHLEAPEGHLPNTPRLPNRQERAATKHTRPSAEKR